jgi:hypothetical protein
MASNPCRGTVAVLPKRSQAMSEWRSNVKKRRMGKTVAESERSAVSFQGIEMKRNVCGLCHFIKGHRDS